jgi:hypothetical protein
MHPPSLLAYRAPFAAPCLICQIFTVSPGPVTPSPSPIAALLSPPHSTVLHVHRDPASTPRFARPVYSMWRWPPAHRHRRTSAPLRSLHPAWVSSSPTMLCAVVPAIISFLPSLGPLGPFVLGLLHSPSLTDCVIIHSCRAFARAPNPLYPCLSPRDHPRVALNTNGHRTHYAMSLGYRRAMVSANNTA